jgi:hypothetical protein
VGGVAVRAEADFAAREAIHELKGGVSARFPRFPNAKRCLSFVDVACPFNAVFSVDFVATMPAVSANDAVKSGSDSGNGILRFAENPNLDHVAGLSIVGRFIESGRDNDPLGVFMKDKSVAHREPPSAMGTIARSNLVGTGFPSP